MRVQRAVAAGLFLLCTGCGAHALKGSGPGGSMMSGASFGPDGTAVSRSVGGQVPSIGQGTYGTVYRSYDDGVGDDAAEAFLAGTAPLWPETSDPKVVTHAGRLRWEMETKLRRGFASAGRYMEIIRREFGRAGVPLELGYLPIIESNFSNGAVSPASAVGLWQFTAGTAKDYGLLVTRDVDERRDPEKATRAAAHLLRDLYDRFSRWDLALAAYNAGPGSVERALAARPGARDFWSLRDRLPGETRDYVPKVLATALIASKPEEFGLVDLDRDAPLRYDTYVVSHRLDLGTVASFCGSTREEVEELNPSLRKGVVPQLAEGFPVRLPKGKAREFAVRYAAWSSGRGEGPGSPGYRSEI